MADKEENKTKENVTREEMLECFQGMCHFMALHGFTEEDPRAVAIRNLIEASERGMVMFECIDCGKLTNKLGWCECAKPSTVPRRIVKPTPDSTKPELCIDKRWGPETIKALKEKICADRKKDG